MEDEIHEEVFAMFVDAGGSVLCDFLQED